MSFADVMLNIIDVITGSFNFAKVAEENNAENCLIIRGNQELASIYNQIDNGGGMIPKTIYNKKIKSTKSPVT